MTAAGGSDRLEAELKALRAELSAFRQEQKEMASAINQLLTTFRGLATHLGIATEPYGRRGQPRADPDLPGFA